MSQELYIQIAEKLAKSDDVVQSQMFGKKCLKLNGKAFAAFQHEEMIFKLGKDWISENVNQYSGSKNWDPSGKNRPMKDWLSVSVEFSSDWHKLSQLAISKLV